MNTTEQGQTTKEQVIFNSAFEVRKNGEVYLTGHGANKWTPVKHYWELGEGYHTQQYQAHEAVDAFLSAALGFDANNYSAQGNQELDTKGIIGLPRLHAEKMMKKQAFLQELARQYAQELRNRDEFHTALIGQTCYTLACACIDAMHPANIPVLIKVSRSHEQKVLNTCIDMICKQPLFTEFTKDRFFEEVLFPRK